MPFVVTQGQIQAVARAPMLPIPSVPVTVATERFTTDYALLWRAQPELRTVVDFLARNVAQLGLHVFRRVSDVDRERLLDHPVAALLRRPNPLTTTYRLVDALVHDLGIYDNAYLLKTRGERGVPAALVRIPPPSMWPVGDDWLAARQWEIRGPRGTLPVQATDVIHFRGYNPIDPRMGSSPVESLRQVLAEEWAAAQYRAQLWANGARVSGYISRPADAPDWDDTARERFRAHWQAMYAGAGARAGGTPVLEDGMKFEAAAQTAKDAQYLESRKLTREEVARAYHVPLPMVGILDNATFSNVREQHKNLYQDCLGPLVEMIQQEFELQLLPDLPDTDNIYLEFNFASKLAGSFEEQAAQLQGATGGPYMTRNEARARLNLPQVDGADDLIVPLNVLTGTSQAPVGAEPDDSGEPKALIWPRRLVFKARASSTVTNQAAARLAGFYRRQGSTILNRLSGRKTQPALDDVWGAPDEWDDDLAEEILGIDQDVAEAAATAALRRMRPGLVFDTAVMAGWLAAHAAGIAKVTNTTTYEKVRAALGGQDPATVIAAMFDAFASQRAAQQATTLTTQISGFASVETAKHTGNDTATKTWVAGPKPRPTHAAMSGETVGIEETFSNGARWPGDSAALDADETAGCDCELVISTI